MNFNRKSGVRLGGASKKETSKDELVKQVHLERKLRAKHREQTAAAELIQRFWRGHALRKRFGEQRFVGWVERFGPIAANQEAKVSAKQIADEIIPVALQAVMPLCSCIRDKIKNGAPLSKALVVDPAVIRGALTILLRSIASKDLATNYCALAVSDRKGSWLGQCERLVMMCSAVLGSPTLMSDPLLQAASAQALLKLTDQSMWKCFPQGSEEKARLEQDNIDVALNACRFVFMGLKRLLLNEQQGLGWQAGAVSVSQVIEWVSSAAVLLLGGGVDTSPTREFVSLILSVPELWLTLSKNLRPVKLSALKGPLSEIQFSLLCSATSLKWTSAVDQVWAAANISSLVAGPYHERKLENSQTVRFLVRAPELDNPKNATEYVRNITFILQRAVELARKERVDPKRWCDAVGGLKLWSERTHLLQLLESLEKGNVGLDMLSDLYWVLLHSLPSVVPSQAGGMSLPFLNMLAFTPSFLPKVWNWMAMNLRVPLEAPFDATRGWMIESVQHGFSSLEPSRAHVLGIFCQAYAHLLLVLDDEDFHDKQQLLTLGQNRAIAATLNNLVFFTHCPPEDRPTTSEESGQKNRGDHVNVLAEQVPLLLRRLYERDARRSFCRSALWLGPYSKDGGANGRTNFLAASVVQALLNRTSGRVDSEPSVTASRAVGLANVLLCAPQSVPFKERVEVFRGLIQADRDANRWDLPPIEGGPAPIKVTIRRSQLFGDALGALPQIGPRLRGRLMVTFVDEHGLEEPGMDLGGLMNELVEEIMKAGLNPDAGLFQGNADGLLYPSPLAEQLPYGFQMLKFLGLILGKAMYEGMLLDIPLAPFFLLRLQGRTLMFDDLSSLDPDLHRSLLQVKHFDGDAGDLGLDFTVEADLLGKVVVEELVGGGSDRPVTNENKLQYVHLMADWHVNKKVGRPAQAFAAGMGEVIPLPWLRLFSPKELNFLLSGGEGVDIDCKDLQAHTKYSGGYSDSSPAVKLFWRVFSSLSPSERSAFLKFATACSRPPLGGFKHLQPPLTIHKVDCGASPLALFGGKDVELLPSASTCYNMLKLPNYRRGSTLKKKLLLAIESNTGFGLS
ncbi:hypothetical protein BSKO_00226 [Bryopsis sp. KO-2023]|nr:hypothetical protein BSKO_00226 [Bryopsis sp. KO-2023]